MGYCTRYELKIKGTATKKVTGKLPDGTTATVEVPLGNLQELLVDHLGYDPFCGECKWYEHDRDMREFSRNYPEVLFILKGAGEESDDLWISYYKNGKCQSEKGKIVYEPFDETKLSG